jgi:bleomycin hydrolase
MFSPYPFMHSLMSLPQTYGVLPQAIYPESYHSSLTGPIDNLLQTKLREHALILRRLYSSLHAPSSPSIPEENITATLRAKKEELMTDIYTIMSATLGVPPRPDDKFVWDYYDENGKAMKWEGTPKLFYRTFVNKLYMVNDPVLRPLIPC